ncbi:MAG: hypothetical protein E7170_02315 [Firmicutes bacterium]|nr:hypothetical protein [Bacillota bacterium]
MSREITELDAALTSTLRTLDTSYNQIYEMAKMMDRDQLLNLFEFVLLSTKEKEKLIADRIYDTNDTNLAVSMANINENYASGIHGAAVQMVQSKQNTQLQEFGEELPGNIIR